jgi:hypothetical protein
MLEGKARRQAFTKARTTALQKLRAWHPTEYENLLKKARADIRASYYAGHEDPRLMMNRQKVTDMAHRRATQALVTRYAREYRLLYDAEKEALLREGGEPPKRTRRQRATTPTGRNWTPAEAKELRARYDNGETIRDIADTVPYSYSTVHRMLIAAGGKLNPRGPKAGSTLGSA